MIEIKLLNKSLLQKFILSEEFANMEHLPISRHRAISHIKNPRLEENDTLLLLAYYDNKMVGYLGVLPDTIFLKNTATKSAWLSCLWVNPTMRGKKIGIKLVEKAINVWDRKIIITEFTDSAKNLYDKTENFTNLESKIGTRLYVKSDLQKILPPKKAIFQKVQSILKFIDFVLNIFIDVFHKFSKPKSSKLKIERLSSIDNEVNSFIKLKQKTNLFKRKENELNWILDNPWILSAPKVDSFNKKYYFSSIDKSFEFIPLKIKNAENKLIAFIIFSKRNKSLKMPYCYYEKGYELEIIKIINQQILELKINTFTCFHKELSKLLMTNKTVSVFKKSITRNYLISKSFDFNETNFNIQDGDGDCAFT